MPRLDTLIVRLAGLTVDHLARAFHGVSDNLAALAALAATLEARRDALEDLLFGLVQRAESCKELRRAALEAKRAVHNLRAPKLKPAQLELVLAALDAPARGVLGQWLDDYLAFESGKATLEARMDAAMNADLRGAILGALADEGFNRALRSTAWPQFDQLQPLRRADDGRPLTTAERKLLTYLSRAAWKTSPLSTFMHTGRLTLRAPPPGAPAALVIERKYATTHVNPALLDELRRLRPTASAPDATVHRHPRAMLAPGGAIRYPKATHAPANAGSWRVDRASEIALGEPITRILFAVPEAGQPLGEFIDTLEAQGMAGREAQSVVRILAREGLVRVAGDDAAFDAQLDLLTQALSEDAAPDNPRWLDPGQVAGLLADVRQAIGATGATVEASVARYEHGVASLSGAVNDAALECGLVELEALLSSCLVVNPAYAALVRAWHQASQGAGAIPLVRLLEAHGAPAPPAPGPAPALDAATLLAAGHRAPVTAYFQVACQPDGYRLVLNQAQTFSLSQSLRALPADAAEREALLRTYGDWLAGLHGDAEPVELPLCNRCNGLQEHPRITDAVLDWGNETGHPGRRIAIEDVQVRFDEATQRFHLTNARTGRGLALVYLGGILPQAIWGDAYALTLLCNPLHVALPSLIDAESGLGDGEGVAHAPRLERGSIVMRRALWRVPSNEIRRLLAGTRTDAFLALRGFLRDHGIPPQVFMRPSAGGDRARYYTRKSFRKPLFFDSGNPALYPGLLKLAELAEHVVLVEALPGPGEQWLERVAGERRVSELQVEFALSGCLGDARP